MSDAAAKTVIVPVDDEGVLDVLELLEQPAAATATSAARMTAKRRIY
jgi:hypothetical protein